VTQSVILGVGNILLTDEGAGVHAARRLALQLADRPHTQVLDVGTLSFSLAPIIEAADRLIILDAADFGGAPGTVRCFLDGEIDHFLSRPQLSVHEIGLRDLMDIARLTERLPGERALIAIQPESLSWGSEPTPAVETGLGEAVHLTSALLESWPA